MDLSNRQIKLIRLLFDKDENEISDYAKELHVSPKTIEHDMGIIYSTLNIKSKNKVGIIKYAIKVGLINP